MDDISLIEKIKTLMDIIVSSPLFLFCFMTGISVLIYYLISLKKERKVNKWIFIAVWLILTVIIIVSYHTVIFKIVDNLLDALFMALYFPNTTVYFIILFVSNLYFIISLFRRNLSKKFKIINFINALIVDLLLILIMDTVKTGSIDIYDQVSMYSNFNLMIIMQLNSATFLSWILISLLVSAHTKLKKYDKKELPDMPEIVFEDSE